MTKIEWCDKTINPIVGCTKISAGCMNCFACKMAYRLATMPNTKEKYEGITAKTGSNIQWTGKLNFWQSDLDKIKWRKPKRIFVGSMCDLFHKDVPFEWITSILEVVNICKHHTYIFLTKRPERMKEYFEYAKSNNWELRRRDKCWVGLRGTPSNLWLGVSISTNDDLWMVDKLLEIPAAVRLVSYEPAIQWVNFGSRLNHIDWLIMGAETGNGKRRFRLDWARTYAEACSQYKVPFFFKQDGQGNNTIDGIEYREYPNG